MPLGKSCQMTVYTLPSCLPPSFHPFLLPSFFPPFLLQFLLFLFFCLFEAEIDGYISAIATNSASNYL